MRTGVQSHGGLRAASRVRLRKSLWEKLDPLLVAQVCAALRVPSRWFSRVTLGLMSHDVSYCSLRSRSAKSAACAARARASRTLCAVRRAAAASINTIGCFRAPGKKRKKEKRASRASLACLFLSLSLSLSLSLKGERRETGFAISVRRCQVLGVVRKLETPRSEQLDAPPRGAREARKPVSPRVRAAPPT